MGGKDVYKDIKVKDFLGMLLNDACMTYLGYTFNEELGCILCEDKEVDITTMKSIEVNIEVNGIPINRVNVFGDGTIEFQIADGDKESICWSEFPKNTIIEVTKQVSNKLKK
jgi:hypothetical protein